MEKKNKKPSLYSKFRLWCLKYRIPFSIFPITILCLLGIGTLILYDLISVNFSLIDILTSDTAILVYVILLVASLAYIGFKLLRHFGGR